MNTKKPLLDLMRSDLIRAFLRYHRILVIFLGTIGPGELYFLLFIRK